MKFLSRKYALSIMHIQRTALEVSEPLGAFSSAVSQPRETSLVCVQPICHFSRAVGQI